MAEIDRKAQDEYHIPGIVLMENAGIKGFRRFLELVPEAAEANLLFLAGGGNNGGDALVMARQAFMTLPRARVRVVLARNKLNELAGTHAGSVSALGIPTAVWEEEAEKALEMMDEADVFFDGISGTGLKGALRAPLDSLAGAVNERSGGDRRRTVVAIDVPSGIAEGFRAEMPAVRADMTLTMGLPKTPLFSLYARPLCGRIERISIGFPPELIENPGDSGTLIDEVEPLDIGPESYKGTRGHTAVFAGTVGTTGAAALAAHAAARAGAGLVTLYCDEELYPLYAGRPEGVMVRPLEGAGDIDSELLNRHSSIIAGPGWGRERAGFLERLTASGLPGVADADALRAAVDATGGSITRRSESFSGEFWGGRWVLTPHPGEFRLISDAGRDELFSDPISTVREAAERLNAVLLLKAHICVIAAPDGRYAVVDGMNPAMGTGGTGDVLAGITGGLLAGGMEPFEAACRAAAVHQAAGRAAACKRGWFTAEELLPETAALLWSGGADSQP
jgi:NAD(P)H-hydrate epimerase